MTYSSNAQSVWQQRLQKLIDEGLERSMRAVAGPAGPMVTMVDGPHVLCCSNDYLGLCDHPEIKQALKSTVDTFGNGAGASRLVSGNLTIHNELETASARFVDAENAVYFVSGYQANVGALSTLTGPGDIIFSDELVHASLIDGARLSRAEVRVYKHSDMSHLNTLLENANPNGLKLIVTDAIFSMDGDVAKLEEIVELAQKFNAAIYLDEAHALGVMGKTGGGLASHLGLADQIDVRIATYSKAIGLCGAFVAASNDVTRLIKSRARSLLYTTAPAPGLAGAILKSLEITRDAHDIRARLNQNIETFKRAADKRNLPVLNSETAIQPVMTGSNERTMAVSSTLYNAGFFVQGIRPPTVPPNQGRLRVTLSAKHDTDTILQLVDAIDHALQTESK